VNVAARPSLVGAQEAPHLFAAAIALAVMACGLVAIQLRAWQLEQRYVRTLAPGDSYWREKSRGMAIQRAAFAQPDLLPVYGSSELILGTPHDADRVFSDFPTGFRPFSVGTPAATLIVTLLRLGSLGSALRDKRVVITITSPEFYRPHLEQGAYRSNFSRAQAVAVAFGSDIPYALRQAAARRMLQYPVTLADDPILRWGLEALADGSQFGSARYAAVLPLGLVQRTVLGLSDHWRFVAFVFRHPELHRSESVVPARIEWSWLEDEGARDALSSSRNNPFGFDATYWQTNQRRLQRSGDAHTARMLMPVIPLVVEGLRHEPRNLEWRDFSLLLDTLRALGAKPLVVSAPFPGPFFDYWGVTADERSRYYAEVRDLTTRAGVPMVNFAEHDADRDFVRDPEGHLTDKGWVKFDEVFDAWFHGAPVPGTEPLPPVPAPASSPD
jgi:D-alanine transfer protein